MPDSSSNPSESLKSSKHTFSQHLRLVLCIAGKVATLHALAHRYTQRLSVEDAQGEDVENAEAELNAEQARVRNLMGVTVRNATKWLQDLCEHLEVDMANLPDDPALDTSMRGALKEEGQDGIESTIAFELVLVALGLVKVEDKAVEGNTQREKASAEAQALQEGLLDYTSLSRSLVMRTMEVLGVQNETVEQAEKAIAQFLYFQMQAKEEESGIAPSGDSESGWSSATTEIKQKEARRGSAFKWAATGAGFVLGGVAIGLTGGLAAPVIAPLLAGGLGIAAFSGAGGAILIGTLLGLGGGGLAGYRTHRRLKGLEDVAFEPIKTPDVPSIPSLTATIVASGFLLDSKDSIDPWRPTFESNKVDAFALTADPEAFLEGGQALDKYIRNKILTAGGTELIKASVLSAVYAGVALPLTVWSGASMLLDSDFSRCRDKAKMAGVLLAEILEKQVQGKRPVNLVGYGPGATMILYCLLELHKRELGSLVYSATLISLPDSPSAVQWASARSVISYSLVNCYSANDYILGVFARFYTLSHKIAGIKAVGVEGVEDVDVSDLVDGHFSLRHKIKEILERVERRNEPAEQAKMAQIGKEREEEVKEKSEKVEA